MRPAFETSAADSSDRARRAVAHVSRRQSASGAELACYRFDTLVLGVRSRPGDKVSGLRTMFGPPSTPGLAPAARIDVIEGPDTVLEALVPAQSNDRDRFVSSADAHYCLWDPQFGGKLTIIDRTIGEGFVWYRSPATLPSWEIARPFLHVFKAISPITGLMPVHAAAVARGDRGLLIAGRGGAGKTSMALACFEAGWRYVGDDFLLIGASPFRAVNLYRSARVREDMFGRLRRSMSAAVAFSTDSGEVKGEVDVGRLGASVMGDARIRAIVVPRRAGASAAAIAPLRESAALRELVATTLVALPGDASATYDLIARAIHGAPCHAVDPGPDLAAMPAALATLTD